ncbi:gamma-glutamylcyclotransferase family protein [Phenylobacterium sp.]|uniref:gamma-glutamylcyclotransferase family protein n=1 Tax=Phenylobacterium sp. TaxID=1871053 RepID=UPI002737281E|nr:gamma-glutamylcyclotransferase family protein [Phenylobacterium sp.]MDP3659691.1 gamma-glutamylcyclotransferase family protein [Phenylobacterium sp.]
MTLSLFSYGTLQQEGVQMATFGRLLRGNPDTLIGYRQELLKITDPLLIAADGLLASYPVVVPSDQGDAVAGVVFEISQAELEAADAYEGKDYQRVAVRLKSGREAWVYVKA